MRPEVAFEKWWRYTLRGDTFFVPDDCTSFIPDEAANVEGAGEGWCSRLSMPGYLDSTEWSGVYETEEEALEALGIYDDDDAV